MILIQITLDTNSRGTEGYRDKKKSRHEGIQVRVNFLGAYRSKATFVRAYKLKTSKDAGVGACPTDRGEQYST